MKVATTKKQRAEFMRLFCQLSNEIHHTAVKKGWWFVPDALLIEDVARGDFAPGPKRRLREIAKYLRDRNDGEALALITSEISEALEGLRRGNPADDKIPGFNCAEAELADAIIRIMDLSHQRGWRVGEAIIAKMKMNKGRAFKHGGKLF